MRTILLAFALLNAILMYSSNILHGNISNDKQAILFATVRLLNAGDSTYIQGCSTDSVGRYSMEVDSVGQYLLSCSRMGYETRVLPVTVEAGKESRVDVMLAESAVALDEVTVEGETFVRSKDRLLITPTKQHVKHSGTGYDLLYRLMIPGVSVDRRSGKVTAFNGEVTLYIDGIKASYREVQSLRPKDVDRIEYFDAPYGKYAGDNASINYITKKYKMGGYVAVDGTETIGYTSGSYNAVAKLNHDGTSYTLFAGTDFDNHRGEMRTKDDVISFPGGDITRHYETDDARVKNNSQYAQLNILNNNKKRTLKAALSFVRNHTPDSYMAETVGYGGAMDTTTSTYSGNNQKGLQYGANLYGNFKIRNNQFIEVGLSGNYTDNAYSYRYREGGNIATSTDEDLYVINGNVNYGITFRNKSTLTAKLMHFHRISSSTYTGNTNSWQHLWTGETLFFAQYVQRFGKKTSLYVAPGFSSQQYRLHGNEKVVNFAPRLQLAVSHQPGQNQFVQLNVAIGNSFPQISMLNAAEQQVDFLHVKRGNPQIEDSKMYVTTVAYNIFKGKINFQASGMHYYIDQSPLAYYSIENGKLIQTFGNSDAHNVNINASLTWTPIKELNFKVGGYYNLIKYTAGFAPPTLNAFIGYIDAAYYLKDFAFTAGYRSKYKNSSYFSAEEITIPANLNLSVSYSHGDFRAEVGTNNPFMRRVKYKYELATDAYRYTNYAISKTASQTAYVKLAYTIDFGKKTSRDKNNVNRTIDSAILKAN